MVASGIFGGIGVKIRWRDRHNCPAEAIYVSLSRGASAAEHPGALAYAMPSEGRQSVVFLDRVSYTDPSVSGRLLGYTLAHEVAHILEGAIRHSESGIMKAHWGLRDQYQMRRGRLCFADEDVGLIYQGLDRRESRLVASAVGNRIQ